MEVVIAVNNVAGFALFCHEADWINAQLGRMQCSRQKSARGALRTVDQGATLWSSGDEVLPHHVINPKAAAGESDGAHKPCRQCRHPGNGIPPQSEHYQADEDCFDRDPQHDLGFLDMKQTAYPRVSALTLEEAYKKT